MATRMGKSVPYVSQLQRVIGKEKPECSQTDFHALTKREKAQMCARCLFRLECFTDALNISLSLGIKPVLSNSPEFSAGLTSSQIIDIAADLHKQDIRPVTIDMAEELMPAVVIPPRPKK